MPVDDPTDVEGGLISKHDLLQISIFNINFQQHVTSELIVQASRLFATFEPIESCMHKDVTSCEEHRG